MTEFTLTCTVFRAKEKKYGYDVFKGVMEGERKPKIIRGYNYQTDRVIEY